MSTIDQRLAEVNIVLPPASEPAANYANCVESGALLFVSGKGPLAAAGGKARVHHRGYALSRSAGLDILAVVRLALGCRS